MVTSNDSGVEPISGFGNTYYESPVHYTGDSMMIDIIDIDISQILRFDVDIDLLTLMSIPTVGS